MLKDSYINRKGEAPIYLSFYIAREKIVIPCNLSINIHP
ncbi:MAG: hypothetical protein LBL04_03070 [Bacteroidales bacterium]|nr:hypothetical protein [Bacteroidales bacterium]